MIIAEWYHIPTWLSLRVIASCCRRRSGSRLKSPAASRRRRSRPDFDEVEASAAEGQSRCRRRTSETRAPRRRWPSPTTTSSGCGRRCRSSTSSASSSPCARSAATGSGCARSTPRRRRRSTSARRPGATSASAATSPATCSRSSRSTSTSTSSAPSSTSPPRPGSSSPTRRAASPASGPGASSSSRRWRRPSSGTTSACSTTRRPGRPATTCAVARAAAATSPGRSSSAGRPTTGTPSSRESGIDGELLRATGLAFTNRRNRLQDAFRARVLFPIFSDTGEAVAIGGRVLPGSTDPAKYKNSPETPIYAKSKTLYGLNWAKADIAASDQVVVCEGYTDVIGFHRVGIAAGGGDVRHGVHRGPRAAAQALRQPGRARLRRRRRRPGRRRALLRVGAEVPGPGGGGPAAGRSGSRRAAPSAIRTRSPPPSPTPSAVPRLPAAAGDGRRAGPHARGPGPARRAGDGGRQRAPRRQRPQAVRRAGRRPRSACRSPTWWRIAERRTRRPTRRRRSAPRRTAVRENAEFVAIALLAQDWESIAGWLVEELFDDEAHRRAFLALADAGGDLDRGDRGGRPRGAGGARAGRGRRSRRRSRGRGAQPDRRGRAPAARPAGRRSRTPSTSATTARPGCTWKSWGRRSQAAGSAEWLLGWLHRRMEERSVGDLDERQRTGAQAPFARRVDPPDMAGVDAAEWQTLIERGRQQGSIHAEQVTHVLRNVELTGDVLDRVQPHSPRTGSRSTRRSTRLDEPIEGDDTPTDAPSGSTRPRVGRGRRAPAQPAPAAPAASGRRRGRRARRPTACGCTCARSARSTC